MGIDVMSEILPEDHTYYAYRGSLTTPPCSEGVYWHLLKEPVTASVDQVINFQNVLAETSEGIRSNNRSPQPINGREVVMVAEKGVRERESALRTCAHTRTNARPQDRVRVNSRLEYE